jgi:hypothetical protein
LKVSCGEEGLLKMCRGDGGRSVDAAMGRKERRVVACILMDEEEQCNI